MQIVYPPVSLATTRIIAVAICVILVLCIVNLAMKKNERKKIILSPNKKGAIYALAVIGSILFGLILAEFAFEFIYEYYNPPREGPLSFTRC